MIAEPPLFPAVHDKSTFGLLYVAVSEVGGCGAVGIVYDTFKLIDERYVIYVVPSLEL